MNIFQSSFFPKYTYIYSIYLFYRFCSQKFNSQSNNNLYLNSYRKIHIIFIPYFYLSNILCLWWNRIGFYEFYQIAFFLSLFSSPFDSFYQLVLIYERDIICYLWFINLWILRILTFYHYCWSFWVSFSIRNWFWNKVIELLNYLCKASDNFPEKITFIFYF